MPVAVQRFFAPAFQCLTSPSANRYHRCPDKLAEFPLGSIHGRAKATTDYLAPEILAPRALAEVPRLMLD
jgi:hypothetical protein